MSDDTPKDPADAPDSLEQFPAAPPYEPNFAWIGDMQRSEGPKPARKWLWFKRRQHTS